MKSNEMSFLGRIAPVAILLVLSSVIAEPKSSPDQEVLVFTHVTVIDATGAPAKPDMSVVITGDRITAIGRSGKVRIPKGAKIINASGKYMIPGLWDMHIHSGGYENGKKNFPYLLARGITGVRDMGSPLEEILRLRREVNEGRIPGPRMAIAGPLLQGPLPFQIPLIISVNDEAEAKRTVVYLKERGVDFIKVHDAVPRNIYFAIAEESKRQGIPFAGHVPPSISALEATAAGQRSIEHLGGRFYGVLLGCSTREAELTDRIRRIVTAVLKSLNEKKESDDSEIFRASFTRPLLESFSNQKAASLLSAFRGNNTWQVPTLVGQPLREAINGGRKDLSEEDIRYGKMLIQRQLDLVAAMRRADVKLMAGTDLPLDNPKLHDELILLVEAGLTPLEALQTATRNPAEFLGRLDSFGTVEKGKVADLVLLDANPLEDIHNTQKISLVVFGGKMILSPRLENRGVH